MTDLDPNIAPTAGAVILLLFLSAFFSGSETALTATSRARMHKLESDGDKRAKRVNALIRDRERLIGAILLGNNLVNILASAIATTLFLHLFGQAGVALATLVMTLLVVIFSEVAPKTAAITRPDSIAMFVAPIMRWIVILFAPITWILQFIVRGALSLIGLRLAKGEQIFSAADELRGAVELHHEEGGLEKEARDIFRGALDLDEIRIDEIMIHRKSIDMLDIDDKPATLIAKALKSGHTRLPLYRDTPENIIGVLHAKDILSALWEAEGNPARVNIAELARQPYFAPETTTLAEQLDNFKRRQEHFALVVDEYGSIMGLVTLEDIIEEIVGEIEDEHDLPVQGVRPQTDGSINVDGNVTIRDLNRAMDWNLPDEEAVTVAGLVIHEAQAIPDVGQTFSFHGYRFRIMRRRRNQITAIKVTPIETDETAPDYKDI
ncbi:MAG: HlyC/CorC family transporter [Parvularculaceae bacterium]|nr:HlyC/CorC family transporter [Parvularculaceae bacterium]